LACHCGGFSYPLIVDLSSLPTLTCPSQFLSFHTRNFHLGEVALRGAQKKVDVIGEKKVAEEFCLLLLTVLEEFLQIGIAVVVIPEDRPTIIASVNDW